MQSNQVICNMLFIQEGPAANIGLSASTQYLTIRFNHTADRNDRRNTVLARNKRDFAAATEIPAASDISLTEPWCVCWISMMVRSAGRKRWIALFKCRSVSFLT